MRRKAACERSKIASRLIDAHAHLVDPRFPDIDAVLARAEEAGVAAVVSCGEDVATSEATLRLAERQPMIAVAVGVHPHRALSFDAKTLEQIRALAARPAVVAVGEIGIDRSGRSAPLADQVRAFDAQVRLAAELDLPVVVHVRESGRLVRERLDAYPRVRGLVHCYSEGPDEVEEWARRGFAISFAGTLTFPRSERLRAAVRLVPADRLLFETDAPYLAPVPHRGRRNEPAFVLATIEAAARERGEDAIELAERAWRNAAALFGTRLAGRRA